jgi:hypothetical protein
MNLENQNNNLNNSEEEVSFKDLLKQAGEWMRYLLSKWIFIIVFGLIGGGLGYTYAYLKKTVYIANTTFVLEEGSGGRGGFGGLGGLASMAGLDIGGSDGGDIFQGENILEVYKSRQMIQKTLLTNVNYEGKKILLIDRFIDMNNMRAAWAAKPELKNIDFKDSANFTRAQDSLIGAFVGDIRKKYLKVEKPDKKLSIINAEVKSSDEFFSKTFNDAVVKNVNDFYTQTKTKKSLENIAILQSKADSVRNAMNGAITSAAVVDDITPNLNPARSSQRVAPIQRSQFSAETNKAVLAELIKNLELSKMNLLKEKPLIQIIDSPIYPLNKEKFGKLKGLILGGILGGFFICLILVIKKVFKDVLV